MSTTVAATCSYNLFSECDLPLVEGGDGRCLLHDPRPDKDSAAFLAALRDKIARDNDNLTTELIYLSGVVFPPDFAWMSATTDIEIHKGIAFRDTTFTGEADFGRATFTGPAYFWGATFTGEAHFGGAAFTGLAYFGNATFTGNAYFGNATFNGGADFLEATFGDESNFIFARFGDEAAFGRARFTGPVAFGGATFTGAANFRGATFSGAADFMGARFTGAVDFMGAKFNGGADFRGVRLHERLTFRGKIFTENATSVIHLANLLVDKPEEVFLEGVDLSRVSFLRTDVTRFHFTDVTWPQRRERWPISSAWLSRLPAVYIRHAVVFDHLRLKSEDKGDATPRLVADLYRQLRLNLEGSKQEIEAAYFYVGQMDMRLLDPDIPWWHKIPLRVYRWSAMYGESWYRPLAIYFLLAFLFAFLYMWGGFYWHGEAIHFEHMIAAWYVAATAGGLLKADAQVIHPLLPLVQYVNALADILLLSLTVIALRRQFRR